MNAVDVNPVVIDLGKRKKKQIRNLKCGQGKAHAEVARVLEAVRVEMAAEAEGKVLVPVVMVYKQKRKRRGLLNDFGLC